MYFEVAFGYVAEANYLISDCLVGANRSGKVKPDLSRDGRVMIWPMGHPACLQNLIYKNVILVLLRQASAYKVR